MPILCGAGAKSGLRCIHKRNLGDGVVVCAINADKSLCSFAEQPEDAKARFDKKLKEV